MWFFFTSLFVAIAIEAFNKLGTVDEDQHQVRPMERQPSDPRPSSTDVCIFVFLIPSSTSYKPFQCEKGTEQHDTSVGERRIWILTGIEWPPELIQGRRSIQWAPARLCLLSMSSRSSVDRALSRCSGSRGFDSCPRLRFFLCPVDYFTFHISLPIIASLKFTLFIHLPNRF